MCIRDRVIAGTEKKGSVLTEFEKKLVAYHEVGHAIDVYKRQVRALTMVISGVMLPERTFTKEYLPYWSEMVLNLSLIHI